MKFQPIQEFSRPISKFLIKKVDFNFIAINFNNGIACEFYVKQSYKTKYPETQNEITRNDRLNILCIH